MVLLIVIIVMGTKANQSNSSPSILDRKSGASTDCKTEPVLGFQPGTDGSIFHDLTKEELVSVRDYLMKQPSLNITSLDEASIRDNYIYAIELFLPEKSKALKYLDGSGSRPLRQARVILIQGAIATPNVIEYLVGPLPKPSFYKTFALKDHKTKIPFYGRPFTWKDMDNLVGMIRDATEVAYPLLKESFGYWMHNCTDHCLQWFPIGQPARKNKGKRYSWVSNDFSHFYLY